MIQLKPDLEKVMARFDAWWECAIIDRPLVSISIPKPDKEHLPGPSAKIYTSQRERWFDIDYRVAVTETSLRNTLFLGDALPVAWPNLGPEVFAAFYGCELIFGEDTSWSTPILDDLSHEALDTLRLETNSLYFKTIETLTDALLTAGKDTFIVGYTDLHAGGDALAAFRDPQNLCIDLLEYPEHVKKLCGRITNDFLSVYDIFHTKLSAAGMPSTTWCPATCTGKFHVPSNDFSCMLSTEMFTELFLPGIILECRHMDRNIYHLDGPQALRHLDVLLDVPEIDAIQWVPGTGREYWADWIDVYQKIQRKGKALQILSVPVNDLSILTEVLKPGGVWISNISGLTNREESRAALDVLSRWR